jgi:twitching motility protein PilT
MRDPETMRIALAAGETGHLVLTTLHTTDVASTIGRMTDSFPAERQPTIRQEIAAALSAVFVQMLLPRRGGGRVPAAELLMVGYARGSTSGEICFISSIRRSRLRANTGRSPSKTAWRA